MESSLSIFAENREIYSENKDNYTKNRNLSSENDEEHSVLMGGIYTDSQDKINNEDFEIGILEPIYLASPNYVFPGENPILTSAQRRKKKIEYLWHKLIVIFNFFDTFLPCWYVFVNFFYFFFCASPLFGCVFTIKYNKFLAIFYIILVILVSVFKCYFMIHAKLLHFTILQISSFFLEGSIVYGLTKIVNFKKNVMALDSETRENQNNEEIKIIFDPPLVYKEYESFI